MMLLTVLGFTVFNGLTAFVADKWEFTACQTLARLFLTAEYSLAVIMVGEEFPARLRGRAIAVLISLATVGVMAMAKLQPFVLLPEGAEPELAARARLLAGAHGTGCSSAGRATAPRGARSTRSRCCRWC